MANNDLITNKQKRYQASRRVTLVGAVWNFFLSIGKVTAGFLGNSPAMVADGVHSASDLVSDVMIIVGLKLAKAEPDADHPYGHGKFETMTTFFLSLALFAVALGIVYDAVVRLLEPAEITPPTVLAWWAAIVSIGVKEGLYHYTYRIGKKFRAKTIIANAWHHRSDAISSIAALAGISGALMGMPLLDPVAAIAVALIVGKMGLEFCRDSLKELTDSVIDADIQRKVEDLVASIPEVASAHYLKGRRMGPDILIDVHIEVHPFISVSEGHQIAEEVRLALLREIEEINDVQVHVDTVDDHEALFPVLPSRRKFLPQLESIREGFPEVQRIDRFTPYYLPEGIIADISLTMDDALSIAQAREAADRFAEELSRLEGIYDVHTHLFLSDSRQAPVEKRIREWVKGELVS